MKDLHDQIKPHCGHQHHYDNDYGQLLHSLEHSGYEQLDSIISKLMNLAKKNNDPTKEILANHLKGNASFYHKNYTEAVKHYEYAINMARDIKNHLATTSIGFDLINVCKTLHLYDVVFNTLFEIVDIFQYLDLVDEKVFCLLQLNYYYRIFGNNDQAYRSLNLLKDLHKNLKECQSSTHHCVHDLYIKLATAHLAKKSKNHAKSFELAKHILILLEHKKDLDLCVYDENYLKWQALLIISDFCIEKHEREKSIANLDLMRKFLNNFTDDSLMQWQYKLLRMEHEIFFEDTKTNNKEWLDLSQKIFGFGDLEFFMEHNLRLLNKFHKKNSLDLHEDIIDNYQLIYHKIQAQMPEGLKPHFVNNFEFSSDISFRTSDDYHMKKFVEMGHDLLCEHNLQELAHKILNFVMSMSKMQRGFVKLFDHHLHETIISNLNFSGDAISSHSNENTSCHQLADKVLEQGKPFIKTSVIVNDLAQIAETSSDIINSINRPSIIVMPLCIKKHHMGVIYLDSVQKNIIKKEEDIDLLKGFVSLMANIIHNAPHLESKQNKNTGKLSCLNTSQNKENISHKYNFNHFIGISDKSRQLIELIKHTVDKSTTITLTGNSGVGKEMIAKIIHYNSPRKHEAFVTINCAAIPESLIESELFGHAKGAFTDAKETKKGLFVEADKGTLFLDEIGEMPLNMQVKLLRVLQEKEVTPVGDNTAQKVDVKIICATNRNLEKMVKEGLFREDLYYRISVINVGIPSLCERKEDIPLLVDHALKMYAEENNVPQKAISHNAMSFLMKYNWPGNVRELINVIYNLCIFVEKPSIELTDLEERKELFRMPISTVNTEDPYLTKISALLEFLDSQKISLAEAKQEFERIQIERALKIYNGQITSASYHLQMPRPQVSRLIKKYDIDKKKFKKTKSSKQV